MVGPLKALRDLKDKELFDLVRLLASAPERNSWQFLITIASELRKRTFYATEDYVIRMAAKLAC